MTTSGTYGFYVTRDDIVREVLLNLKKIDGIDPIDPTLLNDVVRKMNLLIKQWQGRADFAPGLKVWTRKIGHLFLKAFTGQYALSSTYSGWTNDNYRQVFTTASLAAGTTVIPVTNYTGILVGDKIGIGLDTGDLFWSTVASLGVGVSTVTLSSGLPSYSTFGNVVFDYTTVAQFPIVLETASLRDINLNDTPLNIMQRRDYDLLPNKVSPNNYGDPGAVLYETNLGFGTLYTDIAGSNDTTKHIVLTYMETVQDIVNNTDTPYYPQEWYRALIWGTSKECAPMLNAKWSPEMEANYTDSLGIAKHKDAEIQTLYFQCGE